MLMAYGKCDALPSGPADTEKVLYTRRNLQKSARNDLRQAMKDLISFRLPKKS